MRIIPGLVTALLFFGFFWQSHTLIAQSPVIIPQLRCELLQLEPQEENIVG